MMVHGKVRFSANGKRANKKMYWNSQRKCCHLLLVPDILKDLARENGVEVHPLDVVVGLVSPLVKNALVVGFCVLFGWPADGLLFCRSAGVDGCLSSKCRRTYFDLLKVANTGFGDMLNKCKLLEDP